MKDQTMKKIIPSYVLFLCAVFCVGMVLGTVFRLILFFTNLHLLSDAPRNMVLYALFNRGLLFDAYVNAFILALPFLLLSIQYLAGGWSRIVYRFTNIYLIVIYSCVTLLSAVDIPYFSYYNARITRILFLWFDTAWLTVQAIFTTKEYYPYLALLALMIAGWVWLLTKLQKKIFTQDEHLRDKAQKKAAVFFVGTCVLFLCIRGDANSHKMFIKTADTFFCKYSFLNQLSLNPVYSFADSFRLFRVNYFDDDTALRKAQAYLGVTKQKYDSPIARTRVYAEPASYPNIVIVLIESMTCAKMKKFGYSKDLTPNLERLAREGLLFTNFYSAGIHTYEGLFATLYSFPSMMGNKTLNSSHTAGQVFAGISNVLGRNGYQTLFICGGDKNFDNMNGFLSSNGFQYIVSRENYPAYVPSIPVWGVHDHVLFDYAVPHLNTLANSHKPFCAVLLTISSHRWINLNGVHDFHPRIKKQEDMVYEYADWAIGRFMKRVEREPWYENTIFVFLGDHGQNFSSPYDMSLEYHHIPLIMFSPKYITPRESDALGLQEDVFPTLMGMTHIPYVNNTPGIDLLHESRPFAYFSSDNKIGVVDHEYFLVMRKDGRESLYRYSTGDITDYRDENKILALRMKDYAYAMLQTSQWMIEHKKVKEEKIKQ